MKKRRNIQQKKGQKENGSGQNRMEGRMRQKESKKANKSEWHCNCIKMPV